MNFDTERGDILLFEFSREMSLDERGLELMLAIARVEQEGQTDFH
jgi:hypothetical protein